MRIVVMCGGSGTRLYDYSLPKPLNYINGRPAITYVLEKANFSHIDFIIASHLIRFQFESVIRSYFKNIVCNFHYLPYFTRGPIESAWLGTLNFEEIEPIAFLDNDVLYTFPENFKLLGKNSFLGYSIDKTGSEAFCFLRLSSENQVEEIKEKSRISDFFGCGVYGFSSLKEFRTYAEPLLQADQNKELYMSMIYSSMLEAGVFIEGIYFKEPILHIGSLKEVENSLPSICQKPNHVLRICFDLDNTLVTSPVISDDYSSVQPIEETIQLLRKLKVKGHIIIIYTARRMKTFEHNVGAVIKDCARITLDTLEKFHIPYDELIFGKPLADIYIDDKALNPYLNKPEAFGLFEMKNEEKPVNSLLPNKNNKIILDKDTVIKQGPTKFLEGEIFYHRNLSKSLTIYSFFPEFKNYALKEEFSELRTEYIKGIPFALLWSSKLLTTNHINQLLENVSILHHTFHTFNRRPTKEDVVNNYVKKLEDRFRDEEIYNFENFETVSEECLRRLQIYCDTIKEEDIVGYIHGDLWFSNILLSFQNKIKFIDMKGLVWKTFTTGGDPLYDYAKLYQSFLGYDAILNNWPVNQEYNESLLSYYEEKLFFRKINLEHVKDISFALILGTLPFISEKDVQRKIWDWAISKFIKNH